MFESIRQLMIALVSGIYIGLLINLLAVQLQIRFSWASSVPIISSLLAGGLATIAAIIIVPQDYIQRLSGWNVALIVIAVLVIGILVGLNYNLPLSGRWPRYLLTAAALLVFVFPISSGVAVARDTQHKPTPHPDPHAHSRPIAHPSSASTGSATLQLPCGITIEIPKEHVLATSIVAGQYLQPPPSGEAYLLLAKHPEKDPAYLSCDV
ncbi:MAG: hypothetical protein U0841_12755 [Chloroflexia bacterium]